MTSDDGEGDLPRVRQGQGATREAQGQQDLVGRVGHRRQRVAGEDGQRQLLGQQGLAEAVAAHRAAEQHPFDDTSGGRHDRHCRRAASAAACPSRDTVTAPCRGVASASVHFVIMGCGRVGSSLARASRRRGHDVAVIDQDESAFRRLGTAFEGRTVTGVGFDRDTLARRASTTPTPSPPSRSGDNSNILAARVARETFGVEHVVGPHLRPRSRRGLPAARHPHRGHGEVDGRPDAAPAAPPGPRARVHRPVRQRRHRRDAGVAPLGSAGGSADIEEQPRAAGSPTSRGWATGILPGPDRSSRRATCVHLACVARTSPPVERVLRQPPRRPH